MLEADKKKKAVPGNSALAAIAEVERSIEETRRSALRLLSERRVIDGGTLNDWMTSEPEDCWPASRWVERDAEYELRIALPGSDPRTIELSGKPQQLLIQAREKTAKSPKPIGHDAGPTVCNRRIRRHVDLPVDFRADDVRATLHNGVLTIIAPKAGAAADTDTSRRWRISFPR